MSHKMLWDILRRIQPHYVICENFEYRQRQRDNLELFSRELIGVVRLYHQVAGCHLTIQSAAQGKGYWNDEKLKRKNVYVKGKAHGRDAVRHLLQWFMFGPGFKYNKEQEMCVIPETRIWDLIG